MVALACSLLLAAGYGYWRVSARNAQPMPESSPRAVANQAVTAPSVSVTAASQALDERVRWKYRYLLADFDSNALVQEDLRQLLLAHEETAALFQRAEQSGDASTIAELKALLADIDDQVRQSLDWARYEQFESLKHSDDQQRQLAEYTGGISNVAPLDAQSERAILEAKLRHKKAYETALMDSGIDRKTLSAEERQYAHATVANALNDYRDNFLIEARALLNDEQYELLSNYETTEFQEMLAEMQTSINGK